MGSGHGAGTGPSSREDPGAPLESENLSGSASPAPLSTKFRGQRLGEPGHTARWKVERQEAQIAPLRHRGAARATSACPLLQTLKPNTAKK